MTHFYFFIFNGIKMAIKKKLTKEHVVMHKTELEHMQASS